MAACVRFFFFQVFFFLCLNFFYSREALELNLQGVSSLFSWPPNPHYIHGEQVPSARGGWTVYKVGVGTHCGGARLGRLYGKSALTLLVSETPRQPIFFVHLSLLQLLYSSFSTPNKDDIG